MKWHKKKKNQLRGTRVCVRRQQWLESRSLSALFPLGKSSNLILIVAGAAQGGISRINLEIYAQNTKKFKERMGGNYPLQVSPNLNISSANTFESTAALKMGQYVQYRGQLRSLLISGWKACNEIFLWWGRPHWSMIHFSWRAPVLSNIRDFTARRLRARNKTKSTSLS